MTIPCVTVTVTAPTPPPTPAAITCTALWVSGGVGTLTISRGTWRNNGGTAGTFTPKVKINDVLTDLELGEQTVAPGATYTMPQVVIEGVSAGSTVVCPDPN